MIDRAYIVSLEDDPSVPMVLEKTTGFPVKAYSSTQALLQELPQLKPIGFFVDVFLDDGQVGTTVIPQITQAWPHCPVIVLTSDDSDLRVEEALKLGADDYVRKPIRPKELLARFRARLSMRQSQEHQYTMVLGDLTFDSLDCTVQGQLGKRFLPRIESMLLKVLMDFAGQPVEKGILKKRAWSGIKVTDAAFYRKIHELKKIIGDVSNDCEIRSVYGVGHEIVVKSAAAANAAS